MKTGGDGEDVAFAGFREDGPAPFLAFGVEVDGGGGWPATVPVPFPQLTLPTNRDVVSSGVAVRAKKIIQAAIRSVCHRSRDQQH